MFVAMAVPEAQPERVAEEGEKEAGHPEDADVAVDEKMEIEDPLGVHPLEERAVEIDDGQTGPRGEARSRRRFQRLSWPVRRAPGAE